MRNDTFWDDLIRGLKIAPFLFLFGLGVIDAMGLWPPEKYGTEQVE